MKRAKFLIIIIAVVLWDCNLSQENHSYKNTMAIINEYSRSIRKKEGIRNTLYGLLYTGPDKIYDGKIHVISLGYAVDRHMQYDEARKYFYSIVDGLLSHVNQNTQLAKYFFHYPVDYSDLKIHFSFEDKEEGCLKKGEVDSIHIVRNEIFYEISNGNGPNVIEAEEITPDVYFSKGLLEGNRSIIRTVAEDLAMHKDD